MNWRRSILQHISRQEHELDEYITEFEDKELIYEERTVPELEYAFKHVFTQEATYAGILEQQRKEFHYQVAEGIEQLYQQRLDECYEELAHHYSTSGNVEKTVEYLLKAGYKAKKNYANDKAISYFKEALELIKDNKIQPKEWKLEALRGAGEIHLTAGRIPEAEEAFMAAIDLAQEMNLPPRQLVQLYDKIGGALIQRHRYDEVIHYGEMGLGILGDDNECLEAVLMNNLLAVGYTYKWTITEEEEFHKKRNNYLRRNIALIRKVDYSEEIGES